MFFIIEVTSGIELIGLENTFDREFKHVGDNENVSILHWDIRVNQKCKTIRTNTGSVGIERVCHIKHLVETRIVIRASESVGYTSQDVGDGVIKVSVLGLDCGHTDDELRLHHPCKILQHAWILIYLGGFM